MMKQEAYPEAAAILAAAGWKPHDEWGVYTYETLVMGFEPSGNAFHVKNWGKDIHGVDYPDDPVEAARWLADRFKSRQVRGHETDRKTVPEVAAEILPPASQGRAGEDSAADDLAGGSGEDVPVHGTGAPADQDSTSQTDPERLGSESGGGVGDASAGDVHLRAGVDGDELPGEEYPPSEGLDLPALPAAEGADAEFEEIEDDDLLALPEPDPEDFDPEPVEEEAPGAFIFGDNLANDRLMRQGQIANHAAILIAELDAVFDADAYAAAYNTVTTGLEKHTGLFIAQNEEEAKAYRDFVAFEAIRNQRKAVETARDAKIDFIRTASREEVATFDPEADWP